MNPLLTHSISLSKPSALDRSQKIWDTLALARSMRSRHTCLCCSGILLRHMHLDGLCWNCRSCHADMPVQSTPAMVFRPSKLELEINMTHELINLTLPIVLREIDDVLDEYSEYPYQLAFSIHEFRQKLIAHVLSQVPNHYAIAGEQAPARKPSPRDSSLLAERMYLETVVRGGILHILRENADRLTDAFLQKKHLEPATSH